MSTHNPPGSGTGVYSYVSLKNTWSSIETIWWDAVPVEKTKDEEGENPIAVVPVPMNEVENRDPDAPRENVEIPLHPAEHGAATGLTEDFVTVGKSVEEKLL